MMHFGSHLREPFLGVIEEWAAGRRRPPLRVKFEESYERQDEPLESFLRKFLACDDTMPATYRALVSVITDAPDEHVMTYSMAAHELLVELYRATGDDDPELRARVAEVDARIVVADAPTISAVREELIATAVSLEALKGLPGAAAGIAEAADHARAAARALGGAAASAGG